MAKKGNRLAGFALELPVRPARGGRRRVWEDHTWKPPSCLPQETKTKRSMREDPCPEHQWEKMQLDPLRERNKKRKVLSRSQVTVTRSKAMQTIAPVGQ
jgi:hypothetical protein